MVTMKPRIVIIGAGIAGLTAAKKLYTSTISKQLFELSIVEGGSRIGGRINSSEFCGDRIEQGATWIHGIEGSPVYKIAEKEGLLHSPQPWECMDGGPENFIPVAEGGHELNPSIFYPISSFFENLIDFVKGKAVDEDGDSSGIVKHFIKNCGRGNLSVGSFLRQGLDAYRGLVKDEKEIIGVGNWSRKSLEEAIFNMHWNMFRAFTSADDLGTLDLNAEREYKTFPGEDITIPRGYSGVIESLASVLPVGMIQLGRKVDKIEWQLKNGHEGRPVKLHLSDGSFISADHVIVTVSLGVLKRGIEQDSSMFDPPLPSFKIQAISRLGYGVVDKVFLQLPSQETSDFKFPLLQMVFHQPDSALRHPKIPNWMRRASLLYPIYTNSRVVLAWFTGKEALEIESLSEEEIIDGFSITASNLLSSKLSSQIKLNCNGSEDYGLKFEKVLRTQWGTDPLFLGSYSYVAVGSSGDDLDALAKPLPENSDLDSTPPLQILFAGEATHRTHYSTTHGAHLSGLREANRLLEYYNYTDV
ncbi:Flavin-containing amine oxidase [Handroanthus impetiginosus]|uniref:Flavin-containing amine oxidase n=1 Tax=Handroanthus impetiginosus TaxID=429701 RepID=A0A2G9HIB1_9LAMI|nr:Flavin-containing amine oxidase [Handroanthus impetiginosus]